MTKLRNLKHKITTLVVAIALSVGFTGLAVAAPNYTCGTYGSGGYNQNCPDSSSTGTSSGSGSTTVDTTTPAAPGDAILLNNFIEYLNSTGKTLDLNAEQVIYFNVVVDGSIEQHSVTIKEIGENYVTVTFASTPKDVRIFVGETTRQDVTEDEEPDIEATLNSITNGVANMTFKQLLPATSATDTTSKSTSDTPLEKASTNYLIIVVSVLVGLFVLWLLIMLARRRRNQQPGPN